mgnify:CR=1 FL=1
MPRPTTQCKNVLTLVNDNDRVYFKRCSNNINKRSNTDICDDCYDKNQNTVDSFVQMMKLRAGLTHIPQFAIEEAFSRMNE